jgi:GntR family transcriptional regulator
MKTRGRPRSISVREALTQRIDDGQLAAGTRLPSEPALASELGVSRATLREALRALESEGLVRRMWGSGTYVAEGRRVVNSLDLNFGVTDAIRNAGMSAGIEQARHWVEPVSAAEAIRLGLEPGQDVLVVERVRTADGKPVVLSRDMLPCHLLGQRPEAADEMLKRPVYSVLEEDLGIIIHHGVASFRPVRADVTVARKLGVQRDELLLAIWQVDYAESGTPVLSSHEYHLADAFDFTVVRRGPGRSSQ